MRSSIVAALLFFVALPLASVSAGHRLHGSSHSHGAKHGANSSGVSSCETCDTCNTCNTCDSCNTCSTCNSCNSCDSCGVDACGCSSCGGSLCSNPELFYQVLYSEFYARNAWYVEYRARESAARRARLYGQDPDAAVQPQQQVQNTKKTPAKPAAPKQAVKAPKVAEPNKAPDVK